MSCFNFFLLHTSHLLFKLGSMHPFYNNFKLYIDMYREILHHNQCF